MSKVPKSRTVPARNGKVARVDPAPKGESQPLSDQEARRKAVREVAKAVIQLHREALKELERY